VREFAGQDYCTELGDNAEDGVDDAEEDRADAVGDEANDDDQRLEPRHQAGGGHQDSPPFITEKVNSSKGVAQKPGFLECDAGH
jgi:hypothetical protein